MSIQTANPYLDLLALAALEHMRFTTRQRVEGSYAGRYRWRQPGDDRSKAWEERFSETKYLPLGEQAWNEALKAAEPTAEHSRPAGTLWAIPTAQAHDAGRPGTQREDSRQTANSIKVE